MFRKKLRNDIERRADKEIENFRKTTRPTIEKKEKRNDVNNKQYGQLLDIVIDMERGIK